MELRNIDTFLKVAGTQNFSKAAEMLGYSQSAVTIQIQKLEKELGIQLFERIGKRVYLTEEGQKFIDYANNLMMAADKALHFSNRKAQVSGKLRIGGVESICTAVLPELLLDFYKECPEVEVVIRSGPTEDLIDMAMSNEIDFVFTLDQKIYRSEWICAVEKEENIVFVTLEDHKLGKDKTIPIQELVKQPFILTENGAAYRYELERMLSPLELEITPILEIGNTETIINLLRKGMGISFLPEFTVKKDLKKQSLAQIHTNIPGVKMYHQLLYHKNKWITKQMQIFIELTKKYFE